MTAEQLAFLKTLADPDPSWQGTGALPGSVMSGQVFWARVGAVALLVGGALCIAGRLGRRRHQGGPLGPPLFVPAGR